jgi:hypothetical protein
MSRLPAARSVWFLSERDEVVVAELLESAIAR